MDNLTQSKSLFRENAIKNLNSIDDIESHFKINGPGSMIFIIISVLFIAGILIYAVYGRLSINIIAKGILLSETQFQFSQNLIDENIKFYNEKLESLRILLNKNKELYKKDYITLADLEKSENDYLIAQKEALAISKNNMISFSNIPSSNDPYNMELNALIFVKSEEGKKILIGMNAFLLPTTLSYYEHGYIKGKVIGISRYPASKESVYFYLGNASLTDDFFSNGTPFIVKIQLLKNSQNESGLEWTIRKGPNFKIEPGTMVTAKIALKEISPLQLLIKDGHS